MRSSGFSKDLLPEIYPCHAVIGTVTEEAAKESGLLRGNPGCGRRSGCSLRNTGESVYFTMERHRSKADRQGDEYLHGSLLCRREADPRSPCCAGTLAASGGTTGGGGVMRWLEKEFGDWEREEGKRRGVSSLDPDERRGKSNSGG